MKFLIPALLLTACFSPKPIEIAPASDIGNVSKLGDKIDTSEERAAAAVTVVIEQADKPDVVKAEGKIALAYLPTPKPSDVSFARERAARADPKIYAQQEAYAKKLQEEVNKMWDKMEADNVRSLAEISALKVRNDELQKDIKRVKQDSDKAVWTVTGAALVVLGGIACAFASLRTGIPILLAGAFAGAIPYIIDSPYFIWICGGTLLACSALGVYWLFDKVRDSTQSSDGINK